MFYTKISILHLKQFVRWEREEIKKGKIKEEKKREKEKEKKEERQRKGKITSSSLINKHSSCNIERICTLRGRGSLLLWLVFV